MKIRVIGLIVMLLVLGALFVATSEKSTSENGEMVVPSATEVAPDAQPLPEATPAQGGNPTNFNL